MQIYFRQTPELRRDFFKTMTVDFPASRLISARPEGDDSIDGQI
jgi:hypothetical protein